MPTLTERQRNLLRLLNQLSQNTTTAIGGSEVEVDFPSVDLNVDFGGVTRRPSAGTPPGVPTPPGNSEPESLRDLLVSLVNEQVEITTAFGEVTGLLLRVNNDYVVVQEGATQTLIRTDAIEFVNEL